MYQLVEQTRRKTYLLAPFRFAQLARRLYTLVAELTELTELTEKVDDALQVTEDVYGARVYSACRASAQRSIARWQSSATPMLRCTTKPPTPAGRCSNLRSFC